jgi:hypothetical protein
MAIETIVTQILKTRRLTRQDQQVIMTEFSRENLSVVHRDLINKVYEALSQGMLKVVVSLLKQPGL